MEKDEQPRLEGSRAGLLTPGDGPPSDLVTSGDFLLVPKKKRSKKNVPQSGDEVSSHETELQNRESCSEEAENFIVKKDKKCKASREEQGFVIITSDDVAMIDAKQQDEGPVASINELLGFSAKSGFQLLCDKSDDEEGDDATSNSSAVEEVKVETKSASKNQNVPKRTKKSKAASRKKSEDDELDKLIEELNMNDAKREKVPKSKKGKKTVVELSEPNLAAAGCEEKLKNEDSDEELNQLINELEMNVSKTKASAKCDLKIKDEEMNFRVVSSASEEEAHSAQCKTSADKDMVEDPEEEVSKGSTKSKKKDRKKREMEELEKYIEELALEENASDDKSLKDPAKNEKCESRKVPKVEAEDSQELKEGNVKTAAQKKKEKREREKQKRQEKYEHESNKNKTESNKKDSKKASPELKTVDIEPEFIDVEEKGKKDRKRPGKKQLAIIQEALKKAKEEEERFKKEEEAKQKAAEEAERLRLEKLKLEQEKKERKKLKEKQRREKMKAEGRLLSKSQKQARARMEATLAAYRIQGIEVPQIGDKKPLGVRLGNYKTTYHRRRLDSQVSTDESVPPVPGERKKTVSLSSQESSGKESLSGTSTDSKDSWDVSSGESSAVTQESEGCHFSCSEDSDILDEISPVRESLKDAFCKKNIKAISKEKELSKNVVKLRSPVVCVLGHVDTGKTKILDHIRKTHVQDSEAGGITQQIGATMIPQDALKDKCKMVTDFSSLELKVPGLLVIDTPGHESFSNLRSRGSSICDIAVLVVDIMHGLEPQTIESINLLKQRKTPFIVALNKVDRIYDWKSIANKDIVDIINSQPNRTQLEFKDRCQEIILQFANQSLNAALFHENSDPRSYVSMVPTSAISGDGMGNLLALVVQLSQSMMAKQLTYNEELQATVLEVKAISGLGTTIDVILVNGRLREGETIVLAGHDGPLVTQIRSLLMPQPLKELRVKNPYKEYKEVEGAQGVKLTGKDLDKAIAGLPLLVARHPQKVDSLKREINSMFQETMNAIKVSERGVYVQASTLGSLEALLEFLKVSKIPYFGVKIGPVVKKDVMKASIMLEHEGNYAVILAFDVKIERDAQELADSLGVKIFQADIIYHLFDKFIEYREDLRKKKLEEIQHLAVFPCKLKILPQFIFNARDPIVVGVSVEAGILKEGTPLCVPSKENLEIGTVATIEVNHKQIDCARKGQEVCLKIAPKSGDAPKMYGRHFDHADLIVSHITRQSIDICKEHYRDVLQTSDWQLVIELKKILQIM